MIKIAPFIKITGFDGKVLQDRITDFNYLYSEEEDDVCELTIESDNPKLADEPAFLEGKSLTVTWGYLDSKTLVNTRKVYIFDTRCNYTEQGIKLTLICHEKFAITKTDTAKNKNINGGLSSQNVTKILLSNEVLDNIDITDENQTTVYKMLDAATRGKNNKLDPRQKSLISESQSSYAKANNAVDESNRAKGLPSPNRDSSDSPRLTSTDEGLLVTLFNGSNSTYRALKDFFDKQPGGPYVIDSRDDTVTIRTRNFASEAIREYVYKGEDGELLSFTPETQNRSKAKTSKNIKVVSWDSSGKEAISQKSTQSENTQSYPIQNIWNASPVPFSPEWVQQKQSEGRQLRVVGPEARKVGIKEWKTYDPSVEEDQGSDRYNRYETNDGRVVYSESLITNVGVERVTPFGVRDGTATTLPDYIRYKERQPETGPAKTLVRGSDDPGNARAFADNRRTNDELDTNPATASVVGNPLLESGKQVKITNVATKHSGKYYIKSVRHKIDSQGYITDIESMVKGLGISGESKKNVKSSTPQNDKANKGFSVYDRIRKEYGGVDTINEIYKAQQSNVKTISIEEQYNATKKIKSIKVE